MSKGDSTFSGGRLGHIVDWLALSKNLEVRSRLARIFCSFQQERLRVAALKGFV